MKKQRFTPWRSQKQRFPRTKDITQELMARIQAVQISGKQKIEQQKPVAALLQVFGDFEIVDKLKANIVAKGYTTPTEIQEKTIPAILSGKDVIGIANTGTGKTAAFLIPLANKIFLNKSEKVLIITPTRELALQIHTELQALTREMGIFSVLCIGGMPVWKQKNQLRQKVHFVIGTPGRLKDLLQQKGLNLLDYQNIVLDEADRMVDIGFIEDIKYFISLLSKQRQSLFFSATVSGKVKEILETFVKNPVTISVKQQDVTGTIDQQVVKVNSGQKKIDQLHDLLVQDGFSKVLIFGRTKWGIEKLTKELLDRGFKVGSIHGNKRQNQRMKTLEQFKKSEINILLATDVASRGLDIKGVSHVINYDMPASYEDYVHRIGRTGRANNLGTALTFVE